MVWTALAIGTLVALVFVFTRYPLWAKRPLAAATATIVGRLLRVRRAHVDASLARAGLPARAAMQMYRSLADGLFELLSIAALRIRPLSQFVAITPAAREAIEGGAVVATAHTANWDLCLCAAAEVARVGVVTKRLSVSWLDVLWQRIRASRGVELVFVGDARTRGAELLSDQAALVMLIDQAPERARGLVRSAFLGAPAAVDLAPALLAMRARKPLCVMFPLRTGPGRYVLDVACVLSPPERPQRAWAEQAMRRATTELERFVRAHPEQWLWMHRRWKPVPVSKLRPSVVVTSS